MNIEGLKIGETYNVRVKVVKNDFGDTGEIATVTVDENGQEIDGEIAYYTEADAASFSPITPKNGTKNSDHAPKYDPCRLFKKGDKVRVVEWNGRKYYDYDHHTELKTGCIAEIWENEKDEQEEGFVSVMFEEHIRCVPPCYLELVTPVEELEPYNVKFLQAGEIPDTYYYWAVMDNMGHEVARFWHEQYEKGQAEAAAEAECARLNAEYRKEQNNA